MPYTRLSPAAVPGSNYSSFNKSGGNPDKMGVFTRLSLSATPGRNYASFAGKVGPNVEASANMALVFTQSSAGMLTVGGSVTLPISIGISPVAGFLDDRVCTTELKTEFNRQINTVQGYFQTECKLYYPPILVDCPNCSAGLGNKTSNRYLHGAPIPIYSNSKCTMCGGTGKRSAETSDTISLSVYFNNGNKRFSVAEYNNIGSISSPADHIITRGLLKDLPRFRKANYILVNIDSQGYFTRRYRRSSEPKINGLDNQTFVVTEWERA